MKILIDINDSFVQDLLKDIDFLSELTVVYDANSFITELWVNNTMLDNNELTFRAQALEMIRMHYCRVYDCDPQYLEIVYEGNIPEGIKFTGPKYRLGYLVTIKTLKR